MTARRLGARTALLAAGLAAAGPAAAGTAEGRALYHGAAPFAQGPKAGGASLPAGFAGCANCHGHSGGGGGEGGLAAPPLTGAALARPRGDLPPFRAPAEVLRAVTQGTGRGGAALSPAMPRYSLSEAEARALMAYLPILGTRADLPPGVTAAEIRVGTALPLSGPAAATGQAVLAGLRDILDPVNARGGIHGRRVRLIAADTAPNGPRAAVQDLLARPVYALAASIWPGTDHGIEDLLAARRVANLASLVMRPRAGDAGPWDADLLPPLDEQQRHLAAAMEACGDGARLALRVAPDAPGPGATRWLDSGPALDRVLRRSGPAGCLGFGLADAALSAGVPPGWQQRIVLPMPAALLPAGGAGQGPWRPMGQAAGQVLVEVLSAAGAAPHEHSAVEAVPALAGFEPLAGLALNFSRTRRHGWSADVIAIPARTDSPGTAQRPAAVPDTGG